MSENSQLNLKSPEKILKKPYTYKEPCGRPRDHSAFNGKDDFFECDQVVDEETREKCCAPKYCHLSTHPACTLTRQEIMSDKAVYMTNNDLCITCLKSYKVCCLVGDHPSALQDTKIKRKLDELEESFLKKIQKVDTQVTSGDYVVSPDFYRYFSCLCKKDNIRKNSSIEMIGKQDPKELEEDENKRRIWSFKENPHNAQWLSEHFRANYLYNRECYDYFLNKLINLPKQRNVLLIYGTPGIGKSMFLNRVFHHIIETYRNSENKNPITIVYNAKKFNRKDHYKITLFKKNDELEFKILNAENLKIDTTIDYHIADTCTPQPAKIFSLYVSSYKDSNKVKFDNTFSGFQEFMPIFSYDELGEISPPDWTEDQRKFRYSILGGCARNFLMDTDQPTVRLDKFLQKAVKLYIPAEFREPTLKDGTPNPFYPHFLSIRLILRDVFVQNFDDKIEENVNFLIRTIIHFTPLEDSYEADWSTTIIKLIASHIKNQIDKKIWKQISEIISKSAKGGLFEASIHPTLFKRGKSSRSYSFKYLDENEKMQIEVVSFNISGLKYIWNPDGIAVLEDDEYGLPLKQNFPAIDAIIQPNILIQITVAEQHPIKKHLLDQCRAKLRGERNTHMLIYIIPPDVKSFQINNFSYQRPQTRSQTQDSIRNTTEDQHLISDIHTPRNNDDPILQLVGYINSTTDLLENLKITKK